MTIAGTFPERGLRLAWVLVDVDATRARYEGHAFTPTAKHAVVVDVDVATGKAIVTVTESSPIDAAGACTPLEAADVAFAQQLGRQLWKLATQTPAEQGGGKWSRRVQRWRGPK
jgi:hypothetical protein